MDAPGGRLSRSEDDQVFAGRQDRARRKGPFPQIVPVVRQAPAVQRDGGWYAVVQLDPVRGISLAIGQAAMVGGNELRDRHRLALGPDCRQQQHRGATPAMNRTNTFG